MKFWKIAKFVKDPNDIKKIEEVLARNIANLKELYISLISVSGYPNITWLDFAYFVK